MNASSHQADGSPVRSSVQLRQTVPLKLVPSVHLSFFRRIMQGASRREGGKLQAVSDLELRA